MADSRRFLPVQGNRFGNENLHRFPLENHQNFQRPLCDPFLDNRPNFAVPNAFLNPTPDPRNALSLHENSQSWNRSQMLAREQFMQSSHHPGNVIQRPEFQPSRVNYGSGGFPREQFVENERVHKRSRVEGAGLGSFTQASQLVASKLSVEDERRLNLIRDHGAQNVRPPQVGMGSELGPSFIHGGIVGRNQWNPDNVRSSNYDYRMDSYPHENLIQERRFNGIDAAQRAAFDERRGLGNDWRSTVGIGNVDHGGADAFATNGPVSVLEPAFHEQKHPVPGNAPDKYHSFPRSHHSLNADRFLPHERSELQREDYNLGFQDKQVQSNGYEFQSNVHYASRNSEESSRVASFSSQSEQYLNAHCNQTDVPLNHQNYGHRNVTTNALKYAESAREGQDLVAHRQENYEQQTSEQGYPNHRQHDSHDIYHVYDHQQLQSKEQSSTISAREAQYSLTSATQMPLAPNVQYHERRISYLPIENSPSSTPLLGPVHTMHHPVENKHEHHSQRIDLPSSYGLKAPLPPHFQKSIEPQSMPVVEAFDVRNANKQGGYLPMSAGSSLALSIPSNLQSSESSGIHPPPPPPPPPLPPTPYPVDAPPPSHLHSVSLPPKLSSPLHTLPAAAPLSNLPSNQAFPESHSSAKPYFYNKPLPHSLTGFAAEGSQFIHQTPSNLYQEEGQPFTPKQALDKPKVIDAVHLFKQPHRATRPDHIVIILRGLPGSGKSYLAKMLRDLEVENGGNVPRIHSMDDYFMTEVEKVDDNEGSKTSSAVKGKKRVTRKVMEYCYEPEMEEAYRSSMLKAFKKTLEEGIFTFIIVDDRNLQVADFAQFWATAKRSGYEVYLLEANYKDPIGCAARNVHGFTADDIRKMADKWEQAPPLYLQLDIQSLFHGDDLTEHGIQEVDMDMEDEACNEDSLSVSQDENAVKAIQQPLVADEPDDVVTGGERWNTEWDDTTHGVKELGMSKWSNDVDDDNDRAEDSKGNPNSLSGLIQAYSKGDKSVHWGDRVGKSGFSIGAVKKPNVSLIIGPGSGYNLNSNPPLHEEKEDAAESNSSVSKRRSAFAEQLKAERESFRAVFDRRRQRIGGLEMDDE